MKMMLGEGKKSLWAYLRVFFSLLPFWRFGYRSRMQEQWQKIRKILENLMEAGPYKVWVAPVQATIEGTTLRLSTVSAFAARRLREQFEPLIREAAAAVLECEPAALTLEFAAQTAAEPVVPAQSPAVQADSAAQAFSAPAPDTPAAATTQQGMLPLGLAPMPKARPRFIISDRTYEENDERRGPAAAGL